MPTTHVFIVDSITFKYHLEYLFAGTGADDNYVDFIENTKINIAVFFCAVRCEYINSKQSQLKEINF